MTADTSVLGLILDASIPVMLVMILLLLASIMSWSIIFSKRRLIRRTKDSSDEFEASFWSGGDLNTLYQGAAQARGGSVGMASIFEAGFREFNRAMQQTGVSADKVVEECQRAMRVAQMREVDRLEQGLATLATIGSTSPYVGLFGTVWGIMNAFIGLAGECADSDAGRGRAADRRSADRYGNGTVRSDTCSHRLQPICRQGCPAGIPLRRFH